LSRTRNPMEGMDVPHIDHLNVLAKSKSKGGVTFGTFQNVTTGETKEKGGGGVPSSPQSPRSPRGVGDPMAQYRDGWDKKAVEGMARDKKLKERNIAQNSVDYRQGLRGVFSAAPTGRNARTGSVAPPPPGVVPPPPSMPPPQPSVSLARPGESIQSSIPDADPNRYVAQGRPETEADKATRLAKQAKESQLAFEARNGGGGGGGGVGRTPTRAPPRIPGGGLPDPSPMLSQSGYDVVSSSSSSSSSSYNTTPLPIRLQLHSAPIPPSPAPPSDYPTDAASIIAEAMRQHAVADSALAGEDVHDEFSSYSSLSGYAGSMGAPPAREGYGAGAGSPRLTSDVPAHLRGRTASLMPSAIPGGEFGESRRTSVVVRENHVRSLQEQHQHEDREAAQAAETDSRRQGRAGRPSPGKAIQRSRSTSPPRRHAPLPPARAAMLGPRLGNRLEPRLWNPTANAGTAGTARTAGGAPAPTDPSLSLSMKGPRDSASAGGLTRTPSPGPSSRSLPRKMSGTQLLAQVDSPASSIMRSPKDESSPRGPGGGGRDVHGHFSFHPDPSPTLLHATPSSTALSLSSSPNPMTSGSSGSTYAGVSVADESRRLSSEREASSASVGHGRRGTVALSETPLAPTLLNQAPPGMTSRARGSSGGSSLALADNARLAIDDRLSPRKMSGTQLLAQVTTTTATARSAQMEAAKANLARGGERPRSLQRFPTKSPLAGIPIPTDRVYDSTRGALTRSTSALQRETDARRLHTEMTVAQEYGTMYDRVNRVWE